MSAEPTMTRNTIHLRSQIVMTGTRSAGHARTVLTGADHFRGCPAAQQQSERINHNGFAAPGFSREQI